MREYIRSLYSLAKFYSERTQIKDYLYDCCLSRLRRKKYVCLENSYEFQYINDAREYIEKCFKALFNVAPTSHINFIKLANEYEENKEVKNLSFIDLLYRMGIIYLYMYFLTIMKNRKIDPVADEYKQKTEAYLNAAKKVSDLYRRKGINRRNTFYINNWLAWYYILVGDFAAAVSETHNARDGYIKCTYALALLLSNISDKYKKVQQNLEPLLTDDKNRSRAAVLLAYVYRLSGQMDKYNLLLKYRNNLNGWAKAAIAKLEGGYVQ